MEALEADVRHASTCSEILLALRKNIKGPRTTQRDRRIEHVYELCECIRFGARILQSPRSKLADVMA